MTASRGRMPKTSARQGQTGVEGLGIAPSPRTLAKTPSFSVYTSGQGQSRAEVPQTRTAPRGGERDRGHVTPTLETNQRPREGATLGAPHPSQRSRRETLSLSLCQLLGGPEPLGSHCMGGEQDRLTLSPHRGPYPAARALDSFRGAQGAAAGPRSGAEGPHLAGTTAPAPGVPRLSAQGPAPQHHLPPSASRPPACPETPTWAQIQLPSGAAASPHYYASYGPPGQNLHPLRCRQNPHYSSTYRPPVNNPGPPSCSAIKHPHYGVSFSAPGPNPDPSKRCYWTLIISLHTATLLKFSPLPSCVAGRSSRYRAPQTPSPALIHSPRSGGAPRPPIIAPDPATPANNSAPSCVPTDTPGIAPPQPPLLQTPRGAYLGAAAAASAREGARGREGAGGGGGGSCAHLSRPGRLSQASRGGEGGWGRALSPPPGPLRCAGGGGSAPAPGALASAPGGALRGGRTGGAPRPHLLCPPRPPLRLATLPPPPPPSPGNPPLTKPGRSRAKPGPEQRRRGTEGGARWAAGSTGGGGGGGGGGWRSDLREGTLLLSRWRA